MGEGGIKNGQNNSDVFYGRPLTSMRIHKLSDHIVHCRHSDAKLRAKTEAGDKELRALRRK